MREQHRSETVLLPVVEELTTMVVTQQSLKKCTDLIKILVQYSKSHHDVEFKIRVKQLLGAWRKIYAVPSHECASAAEMLL